MWQHLVVLAVVPLVATALIAVEAVVVRSGEVADVRAANRQLLIADQLDAVRRAVDDEDLPTLALAVVRGAADARPATLTPEGQLRLALVGAQPVTEARAQTDAAMAAVTQPGAHDVLQVTQVALRRVREAADTGSARVASLSAQYTRLSDSLLTAERAATEGAAALASTRSRTASAVSDVESVIDLSAQASRQLPLAFTAVVAPPGDREASAQQLRTSVGSYTRMSWGSTDLSTAPLRTQALAAITDARTRGLVTALGEEVPDSPLPGAADALLQLRDASRDRDAALDGVLHAALAEAAAASAADASAAERALTTTAASAALALAVSGLVAVVLARRLTRSLSDLGAAAARAVEGEAATAPARGPREVRVVGMALERTAAGLLRVREQAEAVASGDLRRAVDLEPVPGRLGTVLHRSIEAVVHAVEARDALRAELLHRATHDPLTGLPNRAAATAGLSSALLTLDVDHDGSIESPSRGVAVLYVDLDGFKAVNDHHGHAAGDSVLRAVAERLRTAVRPTDLAARLGGDEFVVVLRDADPVEAEAVAGRIVRELQAPVEQDGGGPDLAVGASVGVAHRSEGPVVAEELLAEADAAAYRAKRAGRGRVVVHDAQVQREESERLALSCELRDALSDSTTGPARGLLLCWEPVRGLTPGSATRWLAVPRWERPSAPPLVGAELRGAAVTAGVALELDRWTLRTAALEGVHRGAEGREHPQGVVVELSDPSAAVEDLADRVVDVLVETGLPSSSLTVVVGEGVVSSRPAAGRSLAVLRAASVRVGLRGSGTTPVRDLPGLPADEVWLVASTAGCAGPAGLSSRELLVMALHALRTDVVLDGVVTVEQLHEARECSASAVVGPLAAGVATAP